MKLLTRSRVFDFLAFILIVFPLLWGGFWLHKPRLKLELTELAVPTLILTLAAGALGSEAISQSLIFRLLTLLFNRWQEWLERRPVRALLAGNLFISLLWMSVSLLRHGNLQSGSFDLGIFTNTIWNLTHGHGYLSSVKGGINLFADHQSPIFWLLAPVFSIFPSSETLLIVQALGLSTGAAALYTLGKQYQKTPSFFLAALPLIYWAYLPIRTATRFDFHPEVFMLPLFLWAIAGIQAQTRGKNLFGWIAFLLALGCKESAGPIGVGIGFAWLAGAGPGLKPEWKKGLLALVLGLSTFAIDLFLVPRFLGGQYAYASLYHHLSLGPSEWLNSIFAPSRLKFLFATLAPLGFLPVFSPRVMITALPAYGMLFLSQGELRLSPQFHYGIEPAIGLLWALASLSSMEPQWLPTVFHRLTSPLRLSLWMGFWALFAFGRSEVYWIRQYLPSDHAVWVRTEVRGCVSDSAAITASSPLVPHLATRNWVQQIPDLAASVACVWIDRNLNTWPISTHELEEWEASLVTQKGYRKIYDCLGTHIYERQNSAENCLKCSPVCRASANSQLTPYL